MTNYRRWRNRTPAAGPWRSIPAFLGPALAGGLLLGVLALTGCGDDGDGGPALSDGGTGDGGGVDRCEDGETRCAADAVATCMDGRFGEPVPCPNEESCSFGTCAAIDDCTDECRTSGTSVCVGGAVASCGQLDADPCLDLTAPEPCPFQTTCAGGACEAACFDDCELDDGVCLGSGARRACGDFDDDPCLDLGPAEPCAEGTVCRPDGERGTACRDAPDCEEACSPTTSEATCEPAGFTVCALDGVDGDECYEPTPVGCDACLGDNSTYPDECQTCCPEEEGF